jgi:hypothetical protein
MAANSLIPQWLGESIRNFNGRKRRASQNGDGARSRLFALDAVLGRREGRFTEDGRRRFLDTGEPERSAGARRDRRAGLL